MKQWSLFLCLRYLSRKRIVMLSIAAVTLCCALLITVASLFTGFIAAVENSVGDYLGDIVLTLPASYKIENYSELQQRLEQIPSVQAATAVLGGNVLLLTGPGQVRPAQVLGIDLKSRLRVSPLKQALVRQNDFPDDRIGNGPLAVAGLLAPLAVLPLELAVFGVVLALASSGVFFRDLAQAVGVVLPVLMFLSPVFYPVDAVPEAFRPWMRANPLTDVIESLRMLAIHGTLPDISAWLLALAASVALAAAGWLWFRRLSPGFADLL